MIMALRCIIRFHLGGELQRNKSFSSHFSEMKLILQALKKVDMQISPRWPHRTSSEAENGSVDY